MVPHGPDISVPPQEKPDGVSPHMCTVKLFEIPVLKMAIKIDSFFGLGSPFTEVYSIWPLLYTDP